MTVWLWIALISNVIYWSIFFYLAARRRRHRGALAVGLLHLLFAAPLVVAPIRALIDASYVGYQLGFIRFEGRAAVLPASIILAWALSGAWLAVSGSSHQTWLKILAVGDLLFALNFGARFLLDWYRGELAGPQLQFGEHLTLYGPLAALIPTLLFAIPFVASAGWALARASSGDPPPTAHTRAAHDQARANENKDHLHYAPSAV